MAPSPNGASSRPRASRATCPTDAPSPSATIALPELPIGRHRLIVDGVECALTIAPPKAYSPRRRCANASASPLSSMRCIARARRRDQGIGDFSALARAGETAGGAGAAYLGVSPLHMLFPRDRERASPYHPSDRRFLDPIFIDALDDAGLPSDEALSAALAGFAPAFAAASATRLCRVRRGVGAPSARRSKRETRPSPACARQGPPIRSSPATMRSRDRAAKP